METLTKEDIRAIIGNPSVNDHEVRKIILEELIHEVADKIDNLKVEHE